MTDSTDPVLVNIGCGARFHASWTNFDLHASPPHVMACDLTKGIPLNDAVADAVYSAAVLEHVRPADVPAFLGECRRVLKPNGIIRIAVPDFHQQVAVYLDCVKRLKEGDPNASSQREWMILEMVDQVGRDRSGGGMAAYLAREHGVDEQFIYRRIGEEGRNLRRLLKGTHFNPNAQAMSYVRGGRLGRWLLRLLLSTNDLDSDLRALEIGRFRAGSGEIHRWVYDDIAVKECLSNAEFRSLTTMQHGESRIPHWSTFSLEVDAEGRIAKPDLLIVEGVRA
jgi:predicted SAM-dependent methyltransferase